MSATKPKKRGRRTGQVARLPLAKRETVNTRMRDGVPYRAIAAELAKAGYSVSEGALSRWHLGGYRDPQAAPLPADLPRQIAQAVALGLAVMGKAAFGPSGLKTIIALTPVEKRAILNAVDASL